MGEHEEVRERIINLECIRCGSLLTYL